MEGIIFSILDPENRDLEKAISFLKFGSTVNNNSYFSAFNYYCLGFLYYCAPSTIIQNKSLALSCFRKIDIDSIVSADSVDSDSKENLNLAIEQIILADEDIGDLVAREPSREIARVNNERSGALQATQSDQSKRSGLWVTVFNVAVGALSKISSDKLNDPILMRKVLSTAYELLPFWVRAVVSEELFFNFCFDRRSLIMQRLESGNASFQAGELANILPGDNERPVISKDTLMINIIEEYSGHLFSEEQFYFFPSADSDKLTKAREAYITEALEKYGIGQKSKGLLSSAIKVLSGAKNNLPEEVGIPLFLYDATAFGSGKVGFLITSKMFISKEIMVKPRLIKLGQISSFELKKSFLSAGKVYINDQMMIDCNQGKKESFQKFSEMFNKIIEEA